MKKLAIIFALVLLLIVSLIAVGYKNPVVEKSSCVGCRDCVKSCPVSAIKIEEEKATIIDSLCIDCKLCVKTCTYKAIKSGQ